MIQGDIEFLPGVPEDYVRARLAKAGGNELESGKLASPDSSAALAVNTFAWFHDQPNRFPPFPTLNASITQVTAVDVEYCARFPWRGGHHPWLDAFLETPDSIIGIESKRFEPFRTAKNAVFSPAYRRPVWGENMTQYESMRSRLEQKSEVFEYLDAAQLVKHAFGIVTECRRRPKPKRPFLVYLFAEPAEYAGREISDISKQAHRKEIARFSGAVEGAEVQFIFISYQEWLSTWPETDPELAQHRIAVNNRFRP